MQIYALFVILTKLKNMSYNIFLRNHLSLLSFQSIFLHLQSFSMDKYKAIFHETLKLS